MTVNHKNLMYFKYDTRVLKIHINRVLLGTFSSVWAGKVSTQVQGTRKLLNYDR